MQLYSMSINSISSVSSFITISSFPGDSNFYIDYHFGLNINSPQLVAFFGNVLEILGGGKLTVVSRSLGPNILNKRKPNS